MRKPIAITTLFAAAALMLAACDKPAPNEPTPPEPVAATPAPAASQAQPSEAPAPPAPATAETTPAFVGKVWQVKESSAVAPGTQYSFLADGTLVMNAEGGTPGYGKWTYENGALTMIEEGVPYPTDILKLDDTTFQIRSHNPGEPVTMTLVPAAGVPLPASSPAQ